VTLEKTKKIRENFIFVDFENVQPTSLEFPNEYPFKIILFVGANQTKLPVQLVSSMQKLGSNAEYVILNGSGKNALDFHIAFYLGKLCERNPEGYFHIISKDTGFDILVKYLKEKKILINRYNSIDDIPALRNSNNEILSNDKKIELIVQYLIKRGNAKPRKVETLSNTINSLFSRSLNKNQLLDLVHLMKEQKLIKIDGTKITYVLK
jgi:hypothetical protein